MNNSNLISTSNDRCRSGQLLVLGACIIAFAVITTAAVSLNFNNSVKVISERAHPLVYEFRDVRDKMEQALIDRDTAQGWDDTMEVQIKDEFSDIFNDFSEIELYHGIYFYYDESSVLITFGLLGEVEKIEADITMVQKNNQISGTVTFQIE